MRNLQTHVIPFFDFESAPKRLKKRWSKAAKLVIDSNHYILGKCLRNFESEFAEYLQAKYVVGVGNGFDAIEIALRSLKIGPGSNVAVPQHTFIATWLAVQKVGANVVPIEVNTHGLLDIESLKSSQISIQAVIPVHMHGNMVEMPKLMKWASEKNVKVIEDCAQAHGASIEGRKAGTWGDVGCYSFYPTKNLGALGDAGAIVSNSIEITEFARSYRSYGSNPLNKYQHERMGVNSRLDEIQASILSVNLEYLDKWNDHRRLIAKSYINAFSGKLDFNLGQENSVYHHFIIFVKNRTSAREYLESKGVFTEIHYPNTPMMLFKEVNPGVQSESGYVKKFSETGLSIPLNQWLRKKESDHVIDILTSEFFIKNFSTQ
jgi:dTDP-4-amino-4,6-dideoxygalactose transaminase